MRYVRLGNSGAEVSQLCLGCMGFGEPSRGTHPWSLPEPDARAVTRAALEAGINFFDTANTYSDGSSEEILGRALRDFADRDEVVIASKVGLPMSGAPNRRGLSRKAILGSLEGTLRRLGTGHLDLYQLHRWDPDTPIDETLTTLADCVRAGTVRYLGASSTWAWQFAKLVYRGRAIAAPPFVSFQSHYNVLFREDEREVIPLCVDESVGVLAWSPLARGRLARPWGDADERTGRDPFRDELYSDADAPLVGTVQRAAAALGTSMATVALAWLLGRPGVTAPLVGALDASHIADAVAALDVELPADVLAELDSGYAPHSVRGIDVLAQHVDRALTVRPT